MAEMRDSDRDGPGGNGERLVPVTPLPLPRTMQKAASSSEPC